MLTVVAVVIDSILVFHGKQAAGKVAMVIAMVALLASVAYFYQKMDQGRSSAKKGSDSKADARQGLMLQNQITDVSPHA